MIDDLYKILGVKRSASMEEIKKAYRQLSKTRHPDAGGSDEEFRKVTNAFEILSDAEKRARYDEYGIEIDVEPLAEQALIQLFDSLVNDPRAESHDLMVVAENAVRLQLSEDKMALKASREDLKKILRLAKRINRKAAAGEGKNLYTVVIAKNEEMLRERITKIRTSMEVWTRVAGMLNDLEHSFGKHLALDGPKKPQGITIDTIYKWAEDNSRPGFGYNGRFNVS